MDKTESAFVKKNLLDLEYNEKLQYLNTVVIILFTYVVGIALATLSGQINYQSKYHLVALTTVTLTILISTLVVVYYLRKNMKKIKGEIKTLNI